MFIFSNLATSVDGKIATADRSHFYLGTPADRRQMQVLRKKCDAIVVGASTLRSFQRPMLVQGQVRQPLNIVVSSGLRGISPEWEFFQKKNLPRLLITTIGASRDILRKFKSLADIILIDGKKPAAPQIVSALSDRGIKRLLVEGGGGMMWDFIKEDLLDELHVTLTPLILGGSTAPTLVDGEGFSARDIRKLKLAKVRRIGDELFLTYLRPGRKKIKRVRGPRAF